MSQMLNLTSLDSVILAKEPGSYIDPDEVELNAMWINNYYRLGPLGRWITLAKMRFAVATAWRLRRKIKAMERRLNSLKSREELVHKYENQILPDREMRSVAKRRLCDS